MTDEPRLEHLDDQAGVTGINPAANEGWQPVPLEPETPAYVKEPLFSRKVLAAWAIGTLMVWFTISVIVPEIVRTVKSEISARIIEPGANREGETVIETRRSRVTIKRDANGRIIIERTPVGAAPAAPAVTVPSVEPAPPPPGAPVPAPTN